MKANCKQKIAIILFVGSLFFFCLGSLLMPDREKSELEARNMTTTIRYSSIDQYLNREVFQSIEDYVSDQMIGRDWIQGLYADIQRLIGHRNINERIVLKNNQIVEIYQDNPDVVPYADKLDEINQRYQEADIPFLFVNTPVKASIVSEGEKWNGEPISNRKEVMQDYFKLLKERNIDTFDLTDTLQELYDAGINPYYSTDHHWNYKGVYSSYQTVIEQLNNRGMGLPVLEEEDFEVYTDNHDFYGSGVRTMGGTVLFSKRHDKVRVRYPKEGEFVLERNRKKTRSGNGEIFIDKSIYEENESRYLDYYNINLGGNNRKMLIQNKSFPEGKS